MNSHEKRMEHWHRWNRITREVGDECNGLCQAKIEGVCRGWGGHGHHIRPRGRGGKDVKSNCLYCCYNCHEWIHLHPETATKAGLLKGGYEIHRKEHDNGF